jgi:YidC/Oxa1 family membrane protein insertase
MDKNTIIGLLLIGAIMIGFTYYNKPDRDAYNKAQRELVIRDSIAAFEKTKKIEVPALIAEVLDSSLTDSINQNKLSQIYGPFANAAAPRENKVFKIETDLFAAEISEKGGFIKQLSLKKFFTWEKESLVMFAGDSSSFNMNITSGALSIPSSELYFEIDSTQKTHKISGKDSTQITLRSIGDKGHSVEYIYTFYGNEYNVGYQVNILNEGNLTKKANPISINWNQSALRQEKNLENERNNTTIYYNNSENEVDNLNPLEAEKYVTEKNTQWIGFKQQFFTSVFISESPIQVGAALETRVAASDSMTKTMIADFQVLPTNKNSESTLNFHWYFGPTHYATLQKSGHDLQKQIPLGWGIFGWVNKLIIIPAFNFLGQFNLGYGLVILILTLYIKTLLLAFQFKSYMSQAKMRVLKPEMDDLNEQYKNDDPLKKQQAVMELYRNAGVNPLGGCMPMLFQIPILFALFSFFPNAIELRQEGFLWADDLSTYDSIVNLPFTIPFYGNHVSLFALMMTVSTIIYTRMNNQLSAGSSQMMPQLKWMMYLMPVIFLFVLNSYAAGLNYYYFLANIITFAQQFAFRKLVDDDKIHAKIQENKKKPKKAQGSSFQQRLEEMAKNKSTQKLKK